MNAPPADGICPEVVADDKVIGRTHRCIRDANHEGDQHVAYASHGRTITWGPSKARQTPAPANLDAMTAAYASGDPVAIAREAWIYDEQLRAAGLPAITKPAQLDGFDS